MSKHGRWVAGLGPTVGQQAPQLRVQGYGVDTGAGEVALLAGGHVQTKPGENLVPREEPRALPRGGQPGVGDSSEVRRPWHASAPRGTPRGTLPRLASHPPDCP